MAESGFLTTKSTVSESDITIASSRNRTKKPWIHSHISLLSSCFVAKKTEENNYKNLYFKFYLLTISAEQPFL